MNYNNLADLETGDQSSAAETHDAQTVPLSVVKSMREEQSRLKDQLKIMSDQYDVMRMSAFNKREELPKEPEKDPSDLVTWGEAQGYLNQRESGMRLEMQELKMSQQNPDYQDVVSKFLPLAIKEDPDLAHEIEIMVKTGKNAAAYAYKRTKQSAAFLESSKKVEHNDQAKRILENAERSGNLSEISPGASVNSQRSAYWSMSDEQFRQQMNANLGFS